METAYQQQALLSANGIELIIALSAFSTARSSASKNATKLAVAPP